MNREKTLIVLIFFCFSKLVISQNSEKETIKKNLLFVEVGGPGGYGSVNYEYLVKKINKLKFSTKIGLSTYHFNDYTNKLNPEIIIPIGINTFYGGKHNIDVGLGQTITSIIYADKKEYKPKRRAQLNTNLFIGYRYQYEKGFLFKIGYAPIIENQTMFRNWASLTIGYNF
jgi:hypothetical protein